MERRWTGGDASNIKSKSNTWGTRTGRVNNGREGEMDRREKSWYVRRQGVWWEKGAKQGGEAEEGRVFVRANKEVTPRTGVDVGAAA